MNKQILLILFTICILVCQPLSADQQLELACKKFAESYQLDGEKREQSLKEAVTLFKSYQKQHQLESPMLEYNLGTLHLMLEDYGRSIYHLKKALQLEPNDERIVNNLLRAGQLASVDVTLEPELKSFSNIVAHYWKAAQPRSIQLFVIILSWLFAVWVFFSRNKKGLTAFALAVICMFLVTFHLRNAAKGIQDEVVILQNYNLRSGWGEHNPEILSKDLNAGTSGTLIRREVGWCEVEIDGNRGWLPEALTGIIRFRRL